MKLRSASMTAGLALGVTAAVVIVCAAGAYLYALHHFEALLNTARAGALGEGQLILTALEHQMMENDRSLIAAMVQSFGRQPNVKRVVLLDRHGTKRFTSRPGEADEDLQINSPTCQACHRLPPEQRGSSRVIETGGGTVLRTVLPIANHSECHACHDPRQKINGILLLDYDASGMRATITGEMRWMVAATGALTIFLMAAIALVIRIFVLRRLQRLETTARIMAAGDFNKRVPAEGTDTLAWLGREFNTMADSVTGLIGEVSTQRERLETVINSIDDGIVVLDARRWIIAANDAFLQRAGQSRDFVMGCCCERALPGGCSVTDCPSLSCMRSGERQVRICERRTPEGATVWEEIHASPIRNHSGELMQVVEVWRDISQRREAEAHLAEAHRLGSLGLLASGFSHELNTPLATVLTCVEGILREVPESPAADADFGRIREVASIAREQVMRCRGITQHFLRFSRGHRSPGEVVDVRSAIESVERLIAPTARTQSVTVAVDLPETKLVVRADEAELQHALVNLILNAVQACQPGGKVVVEARIDEFVHVRVADNGCGINPEYLKRIFEPFYGLRKGGTGLGLFLSLNFVRRWGGDIRVSSVEGEGSTFEILLPALVCEREEEAVR